ncbi:conserved hypothetical protein [uncultured Desulfatiglans sp.]|nr:conserved hypothetical protein [uncultured Desulfatiglans sp.]
MCADIGRNDPCPCGSGKKHKKCCLGKVDDGPLSIEYARLSRIHDRVFEQLTSHSEQFFGREATMAAVSDFLLLNDKNEDDDETAFTEKVQRNIQVFAPWVVFNWVYTPRTSEWDLDCPKDCTIAEHYLEGKRPPENSEEVQFIRGVNRKPYSFFEVLEVEPGRSVTLRDILTGSEETVQEHGASKALRPSDIVFARVVRFGQVAMFVGTSSVIIPPGRKPLIIELRKRMGKKSRKIDDRVLSEWEFDIIDLYRSIDESLHAAPVLINTDGDPLEFHEIVFDLQGSPEEAFSKLATLSATETPEEVRESATTDAKGRIVSVMIPWTRKGHKKSTALENTVLGKVQIDRKRITVSVNSAGRAKQIRAEIEKRMGKAVRLRLDAVEDIDSALEKNQAAFHPPPSAQANLQNIPEIQEFLKEMTLKHWESWVDEKIPALGGRTPRQMVKTRDGREAVEALLAEAERMATPDEFMRTVNLLGVSHARKTLGLQK